MKKLARVCVWWLSAMGFVATLSVSAVAESPSPDVLLGSVRQTTLLQKKQDLQGQLRRRSVKIPFQINQRNRLLCYLYYANERWERFQLDFQEKGQKLYYGDSKSLKPLPVEKYQESIAGTDISYEDLSMRFLYWKDGKILPEDSSSVVKGRSCWVIQLANPTPSVGLYAWVRVWIDKENGAMWQLDGIDAKGELRKRFLVTSVMKLDDGNWFFKQIKVETRDPQNSRRVQSLSYIDMKSPE